MPLALMLPSPLPSLLPLLSPTPPKIPSSRPEAPAQTPNSPPNCRRAGAERSQHFVFAFALAVAFAFAFAFFLVFSLSIPSNASEPASSRSYPKAPQTLSTPQTPYLHQNKSNKLGVFTLPTCYR
jgi:hypothetical protein